MKLKNIHAAPALLIIILAMQCAVTFIDPSKIGLDQNLYLTVVVLQLLVFALPSLFFVKLRGHSYKQNLRFRLISFSHYPLIFSALGLLICGSAVISMAVYAVMPAEYAASSISNDASFVSGNTFYDVIYIGVTFALLPAVTEEFLFRSILAAEYERSGVITAALISSVAFALFHMSVAQIPVKLFAALLLFAVMYATRSVFASMIVHFLNNIAFFFIDSAMPRVFYGSAATPALMTFILLSLTAIFTILFFSQCEKAYKKYAENGYSSKYVTLRGKKALPSLLVSVISPTFLIFVIFSVIIIAIA